MIFEKKETCIFAGKCSSQTNEIKSERNYSNNNLNTEDKIIINFKETFNLTKLEDINNKNDESSLIQNNNVLKLKLTNSDFYKKVNCENFFENKINSNEKNLLELDNISNQQKFDQIKNNNEINLINLAESLSEKDKINNLIIIDESTIYEEIPEDINRTSKNQIEDLDLNIDSLYENIINETNINKKEGNPNSQKNIKDDYYHNNTTVENIYKIENGNKIDLNTNYYLNQKIEETIIKSENLNLDKSNCESKSFDLINMHEDMENKSAVEKDDPSSFRGKLFFFIMIKI